MLVSAIIHKVCICDCHKFYKEMQTWYTVLNSRLKYSFEQQVLYLNINALEDFIAVTMVLYTIYLRTEGHFTDQFYTEHKIQWALQIITF